MPEYEFEIGQNITFLYRNVAYDAKIMDIRFEPKEKDFCYHVHFSGWNHRYDETINVHKTKESLFNVPPNQYVRAHPDVKLDPSQLKKAMSGGPGSERVRPIEDDEEPTTSRATTSSQRTPKVPKRPVVDPNAPARHDLTVNLPAQLRSMLADDNDLVSRHFHTVVPAKFSIDRIIGDYCKSIPATNEQIRNMDDLFIEYENNAESKITNVALICTARGLSDYFNVISGYQLLYKFERNQYNDLIQQVAADKGIRRGNIATLPEHGFRASEYYGIVHLVRMLARLPELLKLTRWNDHLINRVMVGVHDFLVFLNKNYHVYYNGEQDYQSASPEYYRRAQILDDAIANNQ